MTDPAPDRFHCPWLGREVELPGECLIRIEDHHPDLLPRHRTALAEVLADPDLVRRGDVATSVLLFSRRYADLAPGREAVVVVVDDSRAPGRCRIITAYLARTIAGGGVLWRRG